MKDYKNRGNGVRERKGTAEARAQLSAAFHVAQDQVTPECHREAAWFPEVGHGRDGVNTPIHTIPVNSIARLSKYNASLNAFPCHKVNAHALAQDSVSQWEGVSQGQLALPRGQGGRLAETTAWQVQQGGGGAGQTGLKVESANHAQRQAWL